MSAFTVATVEALRYARHEAACMRSDLEDGIAAKTLADRRQHLNEAIRRHAAIGRELRTALTNVSHASQVLSMTYPANLGGGSGPDRIGGV